MIPKDNKIIVSRAPVNDKFDSHFFKEMVDIFPEILILGEERTEFLDGIVQPVLKSLDGLLT